MRAMAPDRGFSRWLRVVSYTAPAVGSAVLLHAGVQGCVSAQGVAEAAVTCAAAGGMLLRSERSRAQIVLWLLSCQVLTHLLLQVHCPADAAVPGIEAPRLIAAHLAAAALGAALLRPTERAMWSAARVGPAVARAAASLVRPHRPGAVALPFSPPLTAPSVQVLPRRDAACPPPVRRGPPACSALG